MTAVAEVVGVVVIVFASVWYFKSSRVRGMINMVPGPTSLPLIGTVHLLLANGSELYSDIMNFANEFKQHGMFRMWMGPRPEVAVYRAELCEVLLSSTKQVDKSWAYGFLQPWLGTGLLTSNGRKWHGRRKMLTPTFHFKILSDFVPVFNEQARILKEKLRSKVGDKPFNIFPYITLCTLDIICETAMGRQIHAQSNSNSKYVAAVNRMTTIIINRTKAPWFWSDFIFNLLGDGAEHKQCLDVLHGFTNKVIKEKREEFDQSKTMSPEDRNGSGRKRLAFMDLLLHMSEDGQSLSDDDIREEVDTFMFEGHDTTAAALNWVVHLIGAHPEIQRKLQKEIDDIFGDSDRPITVDDLRELKYTECCIKEALRLYPSVPMFIRCLSSDLQIGDYVIPKDTSVYTLIGPLHRDPRFFPEPEVYQPERFLPENQNGRHPYAYIPFSAGMRNCIGQRFAVMEEKVVICSLFRQFNICSHQTREELKPVGDLILRPENGIIVTLANRR